MSLTNQILTILVASLTTMLTRFLPFACFGGKRKTPRYVTQLGLFLPAAIMGILVVYCYKDQLTHVTSQTVTTLLAGIITAACHYFWRKMFLSIVVGTGTYMILCHFF